MVLFGLFVAYAVSGYLVWAWRFRKSSSPF
jgi:hypothetical protein